MLSDFTDESFGNDNFYVNNMTYNNQLDIKDDIDVVKLSSTKKALIFCSEPTEKANAESLKKDWDSENLSTTIDSDVLVSDFSKCKDYDFVLLNMHGYWATWKVTSDLYLQSARSVIITNEKVTDKRSKELSADLKQKRILILTTNGGKQIYCLTGAYFSYNFKNKFDKKVFFFACCYLAGDKNTDATFGNEFLKTGADAFIYHQRATNCRFAFAFAREFENQIVKGKTAKEAFNTVVKSYTEYDLKFAKKYNYYDSLIKTNMYFDNSKFYFSGDNTSIKLGTICSSTGKEPSYTGQGGKSYEDSIEEEMEEEIIDETTVQTAESSQETQQPTTTTETTEPTIPTISSIQYSGDFPSCLPKPTFTGMQLAKTEQLFEWMSTSVPKESDVTNYISQVKDNGYSDTAYTDAIMSQVGSSIDQMTSMYSSMGIDLKMVCMKDSEGHYFIMDYCFYQGIGICVIVLMSMPN